MVKTRTIRRSRLVPHTIDGKTELVLDRYKVDVPLPPRDWDRVVLNAVTAAAGLLVTAAVAWSTANIGDLLSSLVVMAAAYAAASVFDLAWIMCMALEWLARYDTARARAPRIAGHIALVIAMAAIGVHGWIAGQPAVGVTGAVVSGLAKGGWTLVLKHHAKPLDDRTQQWVDKQRAEAGGQLAMVAVQRELARAQAQIDAERIALRMDPDGDPDESGPVLEDPETAAPEPPSGPMTITDAVRTAADCGIRDPEAVLRYVRTVADANAKPETVARYVRALRRTS